MGRQCDHRAAQCVESTGGIEAGDFREEYECPCGATGVVYGEASDAPQAWTGYGEVFQ